MTDRKAYQPVPLPDRADMTPAQSLIAAQSFLAMMRRRHSVRDFTDAPVDRAVIETCIRAAGTAPSGANHQPWHFVAISDAETKARIRAAAEAEEREFYAGGAGDEWLAALEPIGTGVEKPHLTTAPWLIVIFAQRYGTRADGTRFKNYYVPESAGIASGLLIAALHQAGLVMLTHTPAPMKFLTEICGHPDSEKPLMILVVGHPSALATVPQAALIKKDLDQILTVID
jgi:iodotyrosine deiodinase